MSEGSLGYFIVFVSPMCSVTPFDTYIVDAERFKLWLLIIYNLYHHLWKNTTLVMFLRDKCIIYNSIN